MQRAKRSSSRHSNRSAYLLPRRGRRHTVSNFAQRGKASLCLYQTEEKPAHLHLAFTAENRRQVEAFYREAREAGGKDNGAPGLRPHYHANYYAAFVIGPDGHNIEVVCVDGELSSSKFRRHDRAAAEVQHRGKGGS